jgi:hypothetical protein
MKKLILFSSLIVGLLVLSCQKKEMKDKLTVKNKSSDPLKSHRTRETDPEEIHFNAMIETAGYGLLSLTSNPNFRTIVFQEVQKQFDGDDDVLFKDLNTELGRQGINLEQEMENSLIAAKRSDLLPNVNEVINGFDYFGSKVYLQIFIPFIDKINKNDVPKIGLNYDDDEIMDGLEINDDPSNPGPGYKIIPLTQIFAMEQLIFVVSVNERMLDVEEPPPVQRPLLPGERFIKINRINIRNKKESWGNGRADISHVSYHIKTDCNYSLFSGQPFSKIANPEINEWFTVGGYMNARNLLVSHDDYWDLNASESLVVVLFEQDVRDKFSRNISASASCTSIIAHIRSKEDIYGVYTADPLDYPLTGGTSNPQTKIISFPWADDEFEFLWYTMN